MLSHSELKERALSMPEVRAAYDGLDGEFQLVEELLQARKAAGLTQDEVARRMGTKTPAVSRLEAGEHSPTVGTLRKYADAVGCRLDIRLIPKS